MMVRWQICVCRREVEKKIFHLLPPCYHTLHQLLRIWVINMPCQINWLWVTIGPGALQQSHAYLPVRGFVFFTRPNALIGTKLLWPCLNRHCRQVASSPFFQSFSRTPNKDIQNLWVCCLRREFKTCLVSVLCCSCARAPHFVKLKFHRAFLVWLHCSLCQV